uniref:DAO domain-containing protein n=1 Tax=Macrostomum lignano TaxID=282301 RepID=A0A1I8FPT5_9PLAT
LLQRTRPPVIIVGGGGIIGSSTSLSVLKRGVQERLLLESVGVASGASGQGWRRFGSGTAGLGERFACTPELDKRTWPGHMGIIDAWTLCRCGPAGWRGSLDAGRPITGCPELRVTAEVTRACRLGRIQQYAQVHPYKLTTGLVAPSRRSGRQPPGPPRRVTVCSGSRTVALSA